MSFLPESASHRWRRLRLADRQAVGAQRLLGGQRRQWQHRSLSMNSSGTTCTASSGPMPDHVEVDPFADTLRGHSGMVSFGKIAGERHADERQRRRTSRPASTSTIWASSSAPTRSRRTAGSSSGGRRRGSTRGTSTQLQPVVGVQLRRRPAGDSAETSTRTGSSRTSGATGVRRQYQRAHLRRPADARRARRLQRARTQQLAVVQHDNRRVVSFNWNSALAATVTGASSSLNPRS